MARWQSLAVLHGIIVGGSKKGVKNIDFFKKTVFFRLFSLFSSFLIKKPRVDPHCGILIRELNIIWPDLAVKMSQNDVFSLF